MKIALHQPDFLPYSGFFNKMINCDTFVIYDDAQFVKGKVHNRNRIEVNHQTLYLTVPLAKFSFPKKICDVQPSLNGKMRSVFWKDYHLNLIKQGYQKCPYFQEIYDRIKKIYHQPHSCLAELNVSLIEAIRSYLNISTPLLLSQKISQQYRIKSKSTKKIVDICEALNADTYLSGPSGKKYMDINQFNSHNIKLEFQNFTPKNNLSILHFMFLYGKNAIDLVKSSVD